MGQKGDTGTVDTSNFYTKAEVDEKVAEAQSEYDATWLFTAANAGTTITADQYNELLTAIQSRKIPFISLAGTNYSTPKVYATFINSADSSLIVMEFYYASGKAISLQINSSFLTPYVSSRTLAIPTKTSDLNNDSDFITQDEAESVAGTIVDQKLNSYILKSDAITNAQIDTMLGGF